VVAGRAVAVAALEELGVVDAVAGDEGVETPPGVAVHATRAISRSAAKALIFLG
jgi:hypothetical protein